MLFKKTIVVLVTCQLALLPSFVQAQTSDFDRAFAPRGAEARLSFTVPLGQSANAAKTAPRLGFAVRNYKTSSRPSADWMLADAEAYREVRLGFTLEDTPHLMLNDDILVLSQEEQANLGTAGKIGLGVTAVVLAGLAIVGVIIATDDFSED